MFQQTDLPYARDALEPAISKETLDFHYGKHHKGYVDNLNKLIRDTHYEDMSLVQIVQASKGTIFNNAAQVWNHEFQWKCLTPEQSQMPEDLEQLISRYWGSVEVFETEFKTKAAKHFGSGWAWLCQHPDGSLFTQTSPDAETPIVDPLITPLLVVDLWEHAYYIDYRNDRKEYLDKVWSIINWQFVRDNATL